MTDMGQGRFARHSLFLVEDVDLLCASFGALSFSEAVLLAFTGSFRRTPVSLSLFSLLRTVHEYVASLFGYKSISSVRGRSGTHASIVRAHCVPSAIVRGTIYGF